MIKASLIPASAFPKGFEVRPNWLQKLFFPYRSEEIRVRGYVRDYLAGPREVGDAVLLNRMIEQER